MQYYFKQRGLIYFNSRKKFSFILVCLCVSYFVYDNVLPDFLSKIKEDSSERERAEAMFAEDDKLIVPGFGENGRGEKLTPEEQEIAQKLPIRRGFNVMISNKIPLNRSIPDHRPAL